MENLRAYGAVLKQVIFTSDKACEELCLAIDGFVFDREFTHHSSIYSLNYVHFGRIQKFFTPYRCKSVVTSPMYWAVTECFIIGEYTLSRNNAYGWDTAERSCFERDFENEEYRSMRFFNEISDNISLLLLSLVIRDVGYISNDTEYFLLCCCLTKAHRLNCN